MRLAPWVAGYHDELAKCEWPIRYKILRHFRKLEAELYRQGRQEAKRYLEVGHDHSY